MSKCHKIFVFRIAIVIAVFTFSYFFIFSVSPLAQDAVDTKRPYEAKTIEECINEKACVLWAFQRSMTSNNHGSEHDPLIKKWLYHFNLFVLGDDKNTYETHLSDLFNRMSPYIPFEIKVTNDDVVAVLVVSENFDRDIKVNYRDFFKSMFGKHFSKVESFPRFENEVCSSIPLVDRSEIFLTAIFVKNNEDNKHRCIDSRVFYNLGFFSKKYVFSEFPSDDYYRMNRLHMFLIYLLYSKEIKHGMRLDDALQIIDWLYEEKLQEFNSIK
ncbi:hypothetical protein [Aurantivibrio plasticivorans]